MASVQSLKLQGSTTKTTTTAPIATTNRPQDDASCKAHPVCSNLIGVCCPTAEGVFLGCCEAGTRRLASSSKRHKVTLGLRSQWLIILSTDSAGGGQSVDSIHQGKDDPEISVRARRSNRSLVGRLRSKLRCQWTSRVARVHAEPDVVELSYVFGVAGGLPSQLLTLALPHHAVWKSNFGPPRAIDASMLSP